MQVERVGMSFFGFIVVLKEFPPTIWNWLDYLDCVGGKWLLDEDEAREPSQGSRAWHCQLGEISLAFSRY